MTGGVPIAEIAFVIGALGTVAILFTRGLNYIIWTRQAANRRLEARVIVDVPSDAHFRPSSDGQRQLQLKNLVGAQGDEPPYLLDHGRERIFWDYFLWARLFGRIIEALTVLACIAVIVYAFFAAYRGISGSGITGTGITDHLYNFILVMGFAAFMIILNSVIKKWRFSDVF